MKVHINRYWGLLSKYLKPQLTKVLILGLSILLGIALQLINPQITRFFIDSALNGAPYSTLVEAAIAFIVIVLIQQLLTILSAYMGKSIGWISTNALRADLFKHCLNLDMSFHKSFKPEELIERIDGDVSILLDFFSQLLVVIVSNSILIIGVLILLFKENWIIGLAQTVFVIMAAYILVKVQSIAIPHWKTLRELTAKFYGFIGEHISNTEDIKANGAVSNTMNSFYNFMHRWFPLRRKATVMGYVMYFTMLGLIGVTTVISLGTGAFLWKNGMATIGTIYLFYNYTSYLVTPVDQIRKQLQKLQMAGAGISRIDELLSRKSRLQDGKELLENNTLDVSVNNVSFEYEEGVTVLKDISFSLPHGKILGILGRTGSGKTTIARLIVRLYDPTSGDIMFGSHSVKSIQLECLRKRVAYVTQDVQLFHATVRDNITLFDNDIKDETILHIIDEIGLSSWYKSLPDGLDTMLDSLNSGLSAGEAQLLAIVRVFLKNPYLVILDEASSRLDPVTEKLFQNALLKLLKGRSGIIIAHRLWSLNCADEIMILEQGKIVEYGDREVLKNDKSTLFYSLLSKGIEEILV